MFKKLVFVAAVLSASGMSAQKPYSYRNSAVLSAVLVLASVAAQVGADAVGRAQSRNLAEKLAPRSFKLKAKDFWNAVLTLQNYKNKASELFGAQTKAGAQKQGFVKTLKANPFLIAGGCCAVAPSVVAWQLNVRHEKNEKLAANKEVKDEAAELRKQQEAAAELKRQQNVAKRHRKALAKRAKEEAEAKLVQEKLDETEKKAAEARADLERRCVAARNEESQRLQRERENARTVVPLPGVSRSESSPRMDKPSDKPASADAPSPSEDDGWTVVPKRKGKKSSPFPAGLPKHDANTFAALASESEEELVG